MKFETLSVHAGRDVERATGARRPTDSDEHDRTSVTSMANGRAGFSYSRADNPGRRPLGRMHRSHSKAVKTQRATAQARPPRWRYSACCDRASTSSRRSSPITAPPNNFATCSHRWV